MAHAIYITAPNDVNGNPRRGWLFVSENGTEWHEEGYAGVQAIRVDYLRDIAKDAPRVNVTATEYRRLVKQYR